MPSNTRILAALADLHGGYRLGLMAPGLRLTDADGVLNGVQEYLWTMYETCIANTINLANGRDIILLVNGDVCHGNKYPVELVSTALVDQIRIGAANIKPWLKYDNVKIVRAVSGTGAHEFGESSATSLVVDLLREGYPHKDIKAIHHGLMCVGDKIIDYSHHGAHPGSRLWLRGNVARYFLRDRMLQDILEGGRPADLYLCGHFHQYVREVLDTGSYRSELYILPSFCMTGEHGRQATRSAPYETNGMIAFEIGDRLDAHPFVWTIDTRQKESI